MGPAWPCTDADINTEAVSGYQNLPGCTESEDGTVCINPRRDGNDRDEQTSHAKREIERRPGRRDARMRGLGRGRFLGGTGHGVSAW